MTKSMGNPYLQGGRKMSNMVVRTNVFALNAHRNMKNVGMTQKTASNRLSSGYRINSAADDAAGLAISESMRAQIRGLDQASRNAQDGHAMLLTTEGGLEEIGNMLQRTREALVQMSNDTLTNQQRAMAEQELRQLGQEVASMQRRVEFNSNSVLNMGPTMNERKTAVVTFTGNALVSADSLADIMTDINANKVAVNAAMEILSGMSGSSTGISGAILTTVQRALEAVGSGGGEFNIAGTAAASGWAATNTPIHDNGTTPIRPNAIASATVGAGGRTVASMTVSSVRTQLENRITALNSRTTIAINASAEIAKNANARFGDIRDFVSETSTGANVAYFQVGANSSQGITYDFELVSRAVTAAASTVQLASAISSMPGAGSGIGGGVSITQLVNRVQSSMDDISTVRANLGAVQNRMDYTMRSLDISSENLQDSESRVRNADVAREMMRFTMSNVLQQAAVSMLSQANQLPQNLLQLLR